MTVIPFPHDRVKGRRVTLTCEVIEFPPQITASYSFPNPWTWFFAFAWRVQ